MASEETDVRFLKCGKHGEKRRWSIVCIHLLKDPTLEWIPIPQDRHEDSLNDWLCPECEANWEDIMDNCKLDDVRPICVNCVETIRRVFDRNYKE